MSTKQFALNKINSVRIIMDKNQEIFIGFFKNWVDNNWRGTKTELAKFLDLSVGAVTNFLNGQRGGHETTRMKICNRIGVDYRTLIETGRPIPPSPAQNLIVQVNSQADKEFLNGITELYRGIPLYESGRLAAGVNGIEFDPYESPASMVLVYKPELKGCSRHNLAAIKVGGESMEPTIIKGSIVVVDLSDKGEADNRVFVVNTPDAGMDMASIKRVQRIDTGFLLMSDNRSFSPVFTKLDWNRLCVGRVVWMWRDIRNI